MKVRVRFAPSPTGSLHVGGLRTALFNYLFAKAQNGKFILRIEDTDQERLEPHAEKDILDSLAWAGIEPDESPCAGGQYGPYRQSDRLARYERAALSLIEKGHAYRCYASAEELDQMRKAQQAKHLPPKYDGRHRNLNQADRVRFESEGRKPVVRMRIPDKEERVVVNDLIRGKVAFSSQQLDDQVLLKSDGFPTYHLAVVVDDDAMKISHVLRAEEWLPSTPKHLYLHQWLDCPLPQFAHLPLLLNADRSKMSKRKGDSSVMDFYRQGFCPAGLVNFLALLGWNPGDEREVFSLEQLPKVFSLERVGKAGAVFDKAKLLWLNQAHLGAMPLNALLPALQRFIPQNAAEVLGESTLRMVVAGIQNQLGTLCDASAHLSLFMRADDAPKDPDALEVLAAPEAKMALQGLLAELDAFQEEWSQNAFRQVMKATQKKLGVRGKALFGPVRAAITGSGQGPDLAMIADVFGLEKIQRRITQVVT